MGYTLISDTTTLKRDDDMLEADNHRILVVDDDPTISDVVARYLQGEATIYRGPDGSRLLRLENFSVTNGPNLHVILTPRQNPTNRNDVMAAGYVDLGKIKGNVGNQNYEIPDDVDISNIESVVIYCVPFSVVFSVASLQEAG